MGEQEEKLVEGLHYAEVQVDGALLRHLSLGRQNSQVGRTHFRETASEFQGEKAHFRENHSKPDFFSIILNYWIQNSQTRLHI